jgi:hypothetical protein
MNTDSRLQVNIRNVENLFTRGIPRNGELNNRISVSGDSQKWTRNKQRSIQRKFQRIKRQAKRLFEEIPSYDSGNYGLLCEDYDDEM